MADAVNGLGNTMHLMSVLQLQLLVTHKLVKQEVALGLLDAMIQEVESDSDFRTATAILRRIADDLRSDDGPDPERQKLRLVK